MAREKQIPVGIITRREQTTILAALRWLQRGMADQTDCFEIAGMDHFADTKPLNLVEIDKLCERIQPKRSLDGPYRCINPHTP